MTIPAGPIIAASAPGFQLTARDIDLIRAVYEYRFLHIDHLCALTGRSYKKVHGRVFKLVQHRFLSRIEFPFQKHIYVIGRAGIDVLVEEGMAPRELLEYRLRHQELTELFLKHQLMLIDLRCMLELACRKTALRVVTWREGKDLWDRVVTWHEGERLELPVCPDAFFVLEDESRPGGRNRLNFVVEADRSTTTHRRFQQKLVAYQQYLSDGRQTKKYGIKTFRLVTFTLTNQRADGLRAAAREVLHESAFRHFLFASVQDLSLTNAESILGDIFAVPGDGLTEETRVMLVPPE